MAGKYPYRQKSLLFACIFPVRSSLLYFLILPFAGKKIDKAHDCRGTLVQDLRRPCHRRSGVIADDDEPYKNHIKDQTDTFDKDGCFDGSCSGNSIEKNKCADLDETSCTHNINCIDARGNKFRIVRKDPQAHPGKDGIEKKQGKYGCKGGIYKFPDKMPDL